MLNVKSLDGGWNTPEVAAAQRALVERELAAPVLGEPYQPLLDALHLVEPAPGSTLLDVGCGVGHYGTLLKRHWPRLRYRGTDLSPAMIEQAQAREPLLTFHACELAKNAFAAYDLVLIAQCLELTSAPWNNLARVLRAAPGVIILHKLRLAEDSHWIDEPTYVGHQGRIYLWRQTELLAFIREAGREVELVPWGRRDIVTLVVWERG